MRVPASFKYKRQLYRHPRQKNPNSTQHRPNLGLLMANLMMPASVTNRSPKLRRRETAFLHHTKGPAHRNGTSTWFKIKGKVSKAGI